MINIEEEFVTDKTFELLQKYGFKTKPTQALVVKWLRVKHNIFVTLLTDYYDIYMFGASVYGPLLEYFEIDLESDSVEPELEVAAALELGIVKALELVEKYENKQ